MSSRGSASRRGTLGRRHAAGYQVHFASVIGDLDARPALIGHPFGGMIAEKLLGLDMAVAAIAIDAAQIKGVLPLPLSSLRRWVVPAQGKPLFGAAVANFSLHSPAKVDTRNPRRGPLLLIMGGQDHTVPEAITKSKLKRYRYSPADTELLEFGDRGHSLTIDSGWAEVARACLSWLSEQGL